MANGYYKGGIKMCCQKSVYCTLPYTEGFEYAIKMRSKNVDIPHNPYEYDEYLKKSFDDGYRDGMFTAIFHSIEVE